MKKLLTVLIALSIVFSGFAAEPVANASMVDFSGEASVTWKYDIDNETSGFLNETDVELILSLLPADMTNSTEGSGVWGELVVLVDGDTNLKSEDPGVPLTHDFAEVVVDVATIHVGDVYFGIKSGDYVWGGDFYMPNVLNYEDEDDDGTGFIRDENTTFSGYDQGFVAGFANDMLTIEASVRSKPSITPTKDAVTGAYPYTLTPDDVSAGIPSNVEYYEMGTGNLIPDLTGLAGTQVWRVVYDMADVTDTYTTNDYSAGLYVEVAPIQDLRIAAGGATAFGGTEKEDITAFVGADYAFMIDDVMSVVPAVVLNYYKDATVPTGAKDMSETVVTGGIAYRWGPSVDDSSLLDDFYSSKLAYQNDDNADGNDEDDMLLPGVSAAISYDVDDTTTLPVLVNFYSGDIVENLTVAASAYADVKATDIMDSLQVAVAADYDVMAGDLVITPAAGVLYGYIKDATETAIQPVVRVELAGAISNTTFTAEWSGADFGGTTTKMGAASIKAKIAL